MPAELNLRFPTPDHVIVRFGSDDDGTGQLPFAPPITDKELRTNLPPAPTVLAPRREALIELFDRVNFHPLSIRVLAA